MLKRHTVADLADPPWERGKGEGDKPYIAFRTYLEMGGDRSIAKVAKKIKRSRNLLNQWSMVWLWTRRVSAWEDAQRTENLMSVEEARRRAYDVLVAAAPQIAEKAVELAKSGTPQQSTQAMMTRDLLDRILGKAQESIKLLGDKDQPIPFAIFLPQVAKTIEEWEQQRQIDDAAGGRVIELLPRGKEQVQ